jgi:hypothetical protein
VSVVQQRGRALLAVALVAVALVTALAGCGLSAGAAVPRGDDWTTVAGSATGAVSTTAPEPLMIGGQQVRVVSQQRRRLQATLGIQVFWNSTGSQADMEADATRIFNYVVGLGANSVAINFWFYTNGVYPAYVYGEPGSTPSPATVAMVVANARQHGLRVLVRPLLNENNIKIVGNNWRGSIQPPSLNTWFASYYAFLKPYLQAAQRSKATAFNIGTELDSLAGYENHWSIFEAAVRNLFSGQQLYAVNYGRWQEDPPYEPVPDPAVDAYPILGLGDGASVPELTSAWVTWLGHQPDSVLRKTVLQEVGIAAVAGAYAEPALVAPTGTPIDVTIQQNWFAAACAAAKLAHLAGLYYYAVNSTDQPSDPALTATYAPGSFIGRSDGVIRACFASGWS